MGGGEKLQLLYLEPCKDFRMISKHLAIALNLYVPSVGVSVGAFLPLLVIELLPTAALSAKR